MYSVIEDVLSQDRFSKLDVVAHQPLCALIYDPHRLTDVGRILRTFKIKKNVEVTDNGKIII